jgi:hypothetical protein
MTLWSRPPRLTEVGALLPLAGRRAIKGTAMPVQKVAHLPALLSTLFRTLPMACASFTTITPIEHTGVLHPVLSRKTKVPPKLFWFGGHSCSVVEPEPQGAGTFGWSRSWNVKVPALGSGSGSA